VRVKIFKTKFHVHHLVRMSEVISVYRLEEVPPLPMTNLLRRKKFFVRACYEKYYTEIMDLLGDEDRSYITVTGTPGIGKSVFYLYFFKRYRRGNPDKTIVTAAFSRERIPKSWKVFYPTGEVKESEEFNHRIIPSIKDAIYIYDGAPDVETPLPSQKMVCFSSPNEGWLKSIGRSEDHIALYMPPWTLEELQKARTCLEDDSKSQKSTIERSRNNTTPELTAEEVERRFRIFGGSARYC
jgi:hypothetical protein